MLFDMKPVPQSKYTKQQAPYVYTIRGQLLSEKYGILWRKEDHIAFFGLNPLQDCDLADTWLELGYIKRR